MRHFRFCPLVGGLRMKRASSNPEVLAPSSPEVGHKSPKSGFPEYESEHDDDPERLLKEVERVGRAATEDLEPYAFCSLCLLPFLTRETGAACRVAGCKRFSCRRLWCVFLESPVKCGVCHEFMCGQHREWCPECKNSLCFVCVAKCDLCGTRQCPEHVVRHASAPEKLACRKCFIKSAQ